MASPVFFSWQSDLSANRGVIRKALDIALAEANAEASILEAQRELTADQDTQGLPGSPAVAEAILSKIRNAYAFVADLTFVDNGDGARRHPNPNVLIEYGYAAHALGDGRIIGVMNTASGNPDALPFDLVHKRWPIRFRLEKTSDPSAVVASLAQDLKAAILAIIAQFGAPGDEAPGQAFERLAAPDRKGRLRLGNEPLCVRRSGERAVLAEGPYAYLRFIPLQKRAPLSNTAALELVQSRLQPMGRGIIGGHTGRHLLGAVTYWSVDDAPLRAVAASQLALSGELWGNDTHFLDSSHRFTDEYDFNYVPTSAFEQMFIDTFINYRSVARDGLALSLPITVVCGLANAQGYRLAVNPDYFMFDKFAGEILEDNIEVEATLSDWDADPFDTLRPFFDRVYDAAGVQRPAIRTVGYRQQ
jgi:hypothetical protein